MQIAKQKPQYSNLDPGWGDASFVVSMHWFHGRWTLENKVALSNPNRVIPGLPLRLKQER